MKILKFIWFIYGFIAFSLILILIYPVFLLAFLFFKKNDKMVFNITRLWGKIVMSLLLIRPDIKFECELDPLKSYIFVSNHRSFADILVCATSLNIHFRFLAKIELTRTPLFGHIVKGICFPVDRSSYKNKIESYEKMVTSINKGTSVLIFPEGTRNKNPDGLNRFYNGAFRLAFDTGKEIVPITLWDTSKVHPANNFFSLSPAKIKGIVSSPLNPLDFNDKNPSKIREKVFEIIASNQSRIIEQT